MEHTAKSENRTIQLLDEVHLSEVERWKAQDYAALGEVFADLIMGSLIKAADIANTTKPFYLAKFWGKRVMQEFWRQGAQEKARRLEIGPLNDPESMDVNAAQAGFIKFACMGLFELLNKLEGDFDELVGILNQNVIEYENRAGNS